MILYIFLDIGLLDETTRTIFEAFATILMKDGIISSIYLFVWGEYPSFMKFQSDMPEKIPNNKVHSGSEFSIIDVTSRPLNLCLEDTIIIAFNGFKILIIYLIISKIK